MDNIFFPLVLFFLHLTTNPPPPVLSRCAMAAGCDACRNGGQLPQLPRVPHIPLSKQESEDQRHKTSRAILRGMGVCAPVSFSLSSCTGEFFSFLSSSPPLAGGVGGYNHRWRGGRVEASVVVCYPRRLPHPCHPENTPKFQRWAGKSASAVRARCALRMRFPLRLDPFAGFTLHPFLPLSAQTRLVTNRFVTAGSAQLSHTQPDPGGPTGPLPDVWGEVPPGLESGLR